MNAIIVDDEPKAIELLKSYLQHFSNIKLTGTFRNGLKAFEFLSKEKVDLVLLDINMPHISGISLSKMINPETKVIFTTAYSEYAVESYEVNAVDYLLKPISLDRFTKAISKILVEDPPANSENKVIFIKCGSKTYRVDAKDILFLKKDGNYMIYQLKDQKILARESIAEALNHLSESFIQTHKSYIVNTERVTCIEKEHLQVHEYAIPVSISFREKVSQTLKEN